MVWFSFTTTSVWGIRGGFKFEVVIGEVIEFVVVVKVEVEVEGPVFPTDGSTFWGESFSDPVRGFSCSLPLGTRLACHRAFSLVGRSVKFTIVSGMFVWTLVEMITGLTGS